MKILITGATGMVGEGVLRTCLEDQNVIEIISLSRRPSGYSHPKLKEVIHNNMMNIEPVKDWLENIDACFFCLGISSVGIGKAAYFETTYTLTMHIARVVAGLNPAMSFCYVSGAGTDHTLRSRQQWSRVKGRVEIELHTMFGNRFYAYRPGFLKPFPESRHVLPFYKFVAWMFPLGRRVFPQGFSTLEELGKSMLYVTRHAYEPWILEGLQIRHTAQLYSQKGS